MENEKELLKVIDSFIKVGEAGKKTPAGKDTRLLDAEGLGFEIKKPFLLRTAFNINIR